MILFRGDRFAEDFALTTDCLSSLEKSTYKTVVVYNQGGLGNDYLKGYLQGFSLDFHVIGEGVNVGTTIGRQCCFQYVWDHFPETQFLSEIHADMIFPEGWEDALISYLDTHDEPLISCGIVDRNGEMPFLGASVQLPQAHSEYGDFLVKLREDRVIHGFTNPCIHVSEILKEAGGYNSVFLKGKQCFEDDSMLLGYYYYYGTKANWYPKINYNSVVYHAVAGQRIGLGDDVMVNFNGLVNQYGAMGLKHLSTLHKSAWHKKFFEKCYNNKTSL
jgi:hypothetical protein